MLDPSDQGPPDMNSTICLETFNFPADFQCLPTIVEQLIPHADAVQLHYSRNSESSCGTSGVVKASFSSRDRAVQCYNALKEFVVSNDRRWNVKLLPELPCPLAVVAEQSIDPQHEATAAAAYLAVSGFPDAVDRDAITELFGRDNLLDVVMSPVGFSPPSCCLVKFKTQQLALEAERNFHGYEFAIGTERSRLSVRPYVHQPVVAIGQTEESMDVAQELTNGEEPGVIELSAERIQLYLKDLMDRERINWAELNTEEDLWTLLNKFTKDFGWQPEDTLKEAMMLTLRSAVVEMSGVLWMTDHLGTLIRKWSKVVDEMSKSKTRRRLQLMDADDQQQPNAPGADYVPPPASQSYRKRRKNRGQGLMTVGNLLSAIKSEAARTEATEVDLSPRHKKSCRPAGESSESGEASSSDESDEQGRINNVAVADHHLTAADHGSGGGYQGAAVQPELVNQVVSSVLRMFPLLHEWRTSKTASVAVDRPLCQDVGPLNFSVPPPAVPHLQFGFLPPQATAPATGALPANCPILLGSGLHMATAAPPAPAPQPTAAGQSAFAATQMAPFYCMPPPPPPPPSRPF